jgi:hypothetical protein
MHSNMVLAMTKLSTQVISSQNGGFLSKNEVLHTFNVNVTRFEKTSKGSQVNLSAQTLGSVDN